MKKGSIKVKYIGVGILVIFYFLGNAQMKVGDNPTVINTNSILELESISQGLLMPRVALDSTTVASPLTAHIAGMTVYNTATIKNVTPGFYYNDGTKWVKMIGSGLSVLNTPTTIGTSPFNTLSITGLGPGNLGTDEVVTIDPSTGLIKKVPSSMLVQEEQTLIIASAGQTQFATPLVITDIDKINVYRNGVRVAATVVNATTIQLESEATSVLGDEIRIVQIR
jgi:hypothetical protein